MIQAARNTACPPEAIETILLTGATGFLGHYVVRELLGSSCERIVLLLRAPMEQSRLRLHRLLSDLDVDLAGEERGGRVCCIEGDLTEAGLPRDDRLVDLVIHAAAATCFDRGPDGEPHRTNVEGTRRLLAWMDQACVRNLQLVSTAYCCGVMNGAAPEGLHAEPTAFRNAYERSKWLVERECAAWSERTGAALTIHRPSIIVGDGATGRATRFDGFYVSARACQTIGRLAERRSSMDRRIRIRVPAPADAVQNIVPVDYTAQMIAGVALRPHLHGKVYHLTHPDPPTNEAIRDAFIRRFDLNNVELEFASNDRTRMTALDEAFESLHRPILAYMSSSPRFRRTRVEGAERELGATPPAFDSRRLGRLLDYAVERDWGRRSTEHAAIAPPSASSFTAPAESAGSGEPDDLGDYCDAYFRFFLPSCINESTAARVPSLCATARFIITDVDNGQWACRFENGVLAQAHRGTNTLAEDFSFRVDAESFRRVVRGEIDPQQLFFSGKAEIAGDTEKALRMTVIVQSFIRQCPAPADSAAMREACAS